MPVQNIVDAIRFAFNRVFGLCPLSIGLSACLLTGLLLRVCVFSVKYPHFLIAKLQDCTTEINDSLRLIFGYNRWESVRTLRESFGYKSLVELFQKAKMKFDASLLSHHNPIVKHLARNLIMSSL